MQEWGEVRTCIVCSVHASVCICLYFKEKNTERIKWQSNGNYLWGSGKKRWREQDRRETEKGSSVYFYKYLVFPIFNFEKFQAHRNTEKTEQGITTDPHLGSTSVTNLPYLLYHSFPYIHLDVLFFFQDHLKLKFIHKYVSIHLVRTISLIPTNYYHN